MPVILALVFACGGSSSLSEGDCGFSELRSRRISDFAQRMVKTKAAPEYPREAREAGIGGKVMIRILVDRTGAVAHTCPQILPSRPKPDPRLTAAAQTAAGKWTFQKDFGFDDGAAPTFEFVEDSLLFRFIPERTVGEPAEK